MSAADVIADVEPVYEWAIEVRKWNLYGTRIDERIPTVIRAATRDQVTAKVRTAFGATYDDFRKFWSHDWRLESVHEVQP